MYNTVFDVPAGQCSMHRREQCVALAHRCMSLHTQSSSTLILVGQSFSYLLYSRLVLAENNAITGSVSALLDAARWMHCCARTGFTLCSQSIAT